MASGTSTLRPLSDFPPPLIYPSSTEPSPPAWPLPIVPNFSDWQLGDIVLVERIGVGGAAIAFGQHVLAPAARAGKDWSHCGIYSGDGRLIDATPQLGVSEQSLAAYCDRRALAVLRLLPDATTPAAFGVLVVAAARARIGDPYGWTDLLKLVTRWGNVGPIGSAAQAAAYCSALVVQCYGRVNAAFDTEPGCCPCLPATLATHHWLQDVSIEWRNPV